VLRIISFCQYFLIEPATVSDDSSTTIYLAMPRTELSFGDRKYRRGRIVRYCRGLYQKYCKNEMILSTTIYRLELNKSMSVSILAFMILVKFRGKARSYRLRAAAHRDYVKLRSLAIKLLQE